MSAEPRPHSQKSKTAAYLWWLFLGAVGAHKFYLGRPLAGALYAAGWASIWVLALTGAIMVAWIPAALVSIAVFIDLFTIPGQVRAANAGSSAEPTSPATRRPLFAPREDEPFDPSKADAVIARYLREKTSPAPQLARAQGSKPTFGRR